MSKEPMIEVVGRINGEERVEKDTLVGWLTGLLREVSGSRGSVERLACQVHTVTEFVANLATLLVKTGHVTAQEIIDATGEYNVRAVSGEPAKAPDPECKCCLGKGAFRACTTCGGVSPS